MRPVTPFLWFDTQAEEAARFYTSVFPNSEVRSVNRAGPNGPVMTVSFTVNGLEFAALNGGPHFKFNEAVSFVITCKDQKEVDHYWETLTANGGSPGQCGWLKDKFGLSWQVVPEGLGALIAHPNAMQAMMQMKKLDIAQLQAAAKS